MKMLAMVRYGERAGSGLQGIFKTWQSVYHCAPKLDVTTSGGVDRTTLILGFEGHQPDIEAMKLLYDHPDEFIEGNSTQESKGESKGEASNDAQNLSESRGEISNDAQIPSESKGESKGESNKSKIISLLIGNGKLTLPELAERLNLSIGGVEKIVRQLKKEGILFRKGSTKAGEWVVKDGI